MQGEGGHLQAKQRGLEQILFSSPQEEPTLATPGFLSSICMCGSEHIESACSAGDPGSIPGSGRSPREGNGTQLQYSGLENLMGQRSLTGYSPWDRKELNTTEPLTLSQTKNNL